ncbi:hypothetical protein Hypma_009813 [Hypsizygus marmoreus]|uniref:Uncharacterized protein n=1 Tax=Hypsizygus marmoreus TaxID=39966 RepID=A0A369JNJ2_HYPMA|nr:hypothetical protein Hypma_009813 [Hypsizygus marmoreus]
MLPSSPPSYHAKTITGATCLQRYQRQIFNSRQEVLHFDEIKNGLSIWKWPTDSSGERIHPSILAEFCLSHELTHPICLCPVYAPHSPPRQALILRSDQFGSRHCGEYIAKCSEDTCGYFVPLQRIYSPENSVKFVASRAVPQRDRPATRTAASNLQTAPASSSKPVPLPKRGLKRSYALLDISEPHFIIPPFHPPAQHFASETELLMKLDDFTQPGLYEPEFRALINMLGKYARRQPIDPRREHVLVEWRTISLHLEMKVMSRKLKSNHTIIDSTQ